MKKLFVSVPMKDMTEEKIKASINKMKTIAEAYQGEELELINTYINEEVPEGVNIGIWYLAKSLEMLAEADIFIGISDDWNWRGCFIERSVANNYGIKCYTAATELVIDNY